MDAEPGAVSPADAFVSNADLKSTRKILGKQGPYLEGETARVIFFGRRSIFPAELRRTLTILMIPLNLLTLSDTSETLNCAVVVTDDKVHIFKLGWRIKKDAVLKRPIPTSVNRSSIDLGDEKTIWNPIFEGGTGVMRAAAALAVQAPPEPHEPAPRHFLGPTGKVELLMPW
jgi:hypothetical protein